MGGKKKLSLKQMERMQAKKDEEEKEKKKKEKAAAPSKDKRASDIIPPDPKNEKIIGELKKMPVLTPYTVATRFNMRISVAKDFLEQLEENGIVQLVSGNHDIKIYKPVG
ncbi:MAG: 30S ribosomal protein S25e [Candidatus Bathyarchaeia archaeon]